MSRIQSWNWHLEIGVGSQVHPVSLGEFGEGDEGRIEVADGSRKYRIRDNIWDIGEIECILYLRDDSLQPNSEYLRMEALCNNNVATDIYIVATDITGLSNEKMVWLCKQCEVTKGKKNAFDRNSKAADTVKYFILPQEVVRMSAGSSSYPNPVVAPSGTKL